MFKRLIYSQLIKTGQGYTGMGSGIRDCGMVAGDFAAMG
jgi:hypothetical protein